DGGLAVALSDAVLRCGVGVAADVHAVTSRDGIDVFTALFSESGARALISVSDEAAPALEALCAEHEQPALRIGRTGGDNLALDGLFSIPVDDLREAHLGVINRALGRLRRSARGSLLGRPLRAETP
ncbi:MAG: AIR synthase-related protein, partial [Ornithinimicrobium sp.]